MRRLLRLLALYRPFYGWMALGILASLATLVANVTLMAVSGWFITSMALAGAAQVSMNYFTPAAIIRGAAIVRTAGRYLERLVTHEATMRLLAALRSWFYERIEPLAPAALQRHHSAELLSRIRADIDTLDNFYLRLLVPGITAVLAALIFTIYLATHDGLIALVLLACLVAAGIVIPLLVRKLGERPGRRQVELLAEQRTAAVDGIQGMGELLLYGAAEAQIGNMGRLSDSLTDEQASLSRTQGLSQASLLLFSNLALWLVLWLAIPMVALGAVAKPDLALLTLFTLATFEAVMPLPQALQAYGATKAAAQRLFEIVDTPPAVRDPTAASPQPRHFGIRFEQVAFTYPGNGAPTLRGLELSLAQGERITIRGPSGAGKSTLTRLLLRFHDPDTGTITLGDQPLGLFRGDDLRKYIAVVSQETHLFTATVRDNLLLADPEASQAQLEQACRAAQIHDFIESLPDGYDTWLGEAGATLSGGQARRLAIARAVLKDAPLLILDEPTEGLDATTASQLLATLDGVSRGKSVILISHRRLHDTLFGETFHLRNGELQPDTQQ